MFPNLTDIIKIPLAILAGIILSSIVFLFVYEGLRLPLFGQVIDGRVQVSVNAAIALERAACKGRIDNMVSAAELAAMTAQRDRERALRRMADEAAAQADERAFAAQRQQVADQATIAKLLAEAAADPGLSRPNERDREWRAKH